MFCLGLLDSWTHTRHMVHPYNALGASHQLEVVGGDHSVTSTTRTPRSEAATPDPPGIVIRRPTRADALELARRMFLAGERVDMQVIAGRLSVSRATMHRWLGTRERLLGEVLGAITTEVLDAIDATVDGSGVERFLNVSRPLMETYTNLEPVRIFVAREPELALRVILSERGAVHRSLAEGLRRITAAKRSQAKQQRLEAVLETIIQTSTALVWATIAIGDEPQIDRAMEINRALLASEQLLPRSAPS
jgi:AcrR family transcriptional regulator